MGPIKKGEVRSREGGEDETGPQMAQALDTGRGGNRPGCLFVDARRNNEPKSRLNGVNSSFMGINHSTHANISRLTFFFVYSAMSGELCPFRNEVCLTRLGVQTRSHIPFNGPLLMTGGWVFDQHSLPRVR